MSHLFFAHDILLFVEASEDKIDYIREGLQSFCDSSCQKTNLNKSSILFLSNLSEQVTQQLSSKKGKPKETELGSTLDIKFSSRARIVELIASCSKEYGKS